MGVPTLPLRTPPARRPDRWRGITAALLAPLVLLAAEPAAEPAADQDELLPNATAGKPDPAAEKFWAAVKLLQGKKPADQAAGRAALQAVSDQEYTHAQLLLGNCLLSGSNGFPKEARKGANLLRLAAERGNAFAQAGLGSCYATGTGVKKDDDKAFEWMSAAIAPAADYGRPERPPPGPAETEERAVADVAGELLNDPVGDSQASAHYWLGQILTKRGKLPEAQTHLVAAATAGVDGRSGLYVAATQAALNYAFGRGVPRDLAKADEMLGRSRKLVARQQISLIHHYVALKMVDEFAVADLEEAAGESGAGLQSYLQVNIATTFGDRKSKDYNPAEAVKWYELAAENGQVWAMLQLGLIMASGDLGQPDPARAFQWFERCGGGEKPKHFLGVANLAICYRYGFGTPKDEAKAAALFQKHRQADFICYLGSLGQAPVKPVSLDEAVALNTTWARQKNDPHAQYQLGLRYYFGWGVKADRNEAEKWLQRAAKARHGAALCQLGIFAESTVTQIGTLRFTSTDDLKRAADYYRQGAEVGNVDAMANYAAMLIDGRGVARDRDKAESTYLRCLQIDPAHRQAHCNLGVIYEQKLREVSGTIDSEAIQKYRRLMLEHYEESMKREFPHAARNLGGIYYEGRLVPRDFARAYRCFEQAAEWGMPIAHFQLGYMHERGEGVPVTHAEAAYHYRLAALEGHPEALRRLIDFYLTGTGVSTNLDRAVFWLRQLMARGDYRVLPRICDLLLLKEDYASVVPILRKLTDSDDKTFSGYGYFQLSVCYAKGYGVKPDMARAQKYFDRSVKLGHGTALGAKAHELLKAGKTKEALELFHQAATTSLQASYNLGQMYYFGTHVPQDRRRALQYMYQAARDRHAPAMIFLATLTYNGEPDAPGLEDAILLAQQAENLGYAKATEVRQKLEQRRRTKPAESEETTRTRSL